MHFKKLALNFFDDLKNLIQSSEFLQRHRLHQKDFTRIRKLTFADIIVFLLRMPNKTLSSELADFASMVLGRDHVRRISKQAFSAARQKISYHAFQELLDFSYRSLYQFSLNSVFWHGHCVKAIDGTTMRIPNTPENRLEFQTQSNQHGEVPLCKASALYCVSYDLMERFVIGKCRDSEKNQAIELLTQETMQDESGFRPIITFDRGYPSGELISHILSFGGLFLMRCSTSTFKSILSCPLGSTETSILYKKQKIRIRVVRFPLSSGEEELLITNLFAPDLRIEDFKELYFMRWGVELKFREVKQQLKLENFTGSKPLAVKQELYASLVFSNIASALKSFLDVEIQKEIDGKGNQWDYQANRNFLFGEVKKTMHVFLTKGNDAKKELDDLLFLSQKERSPIRIGRTWERSRHLYHKTATYPSNQRSAV